MCKVLRMFVNILTANHKYSVINRDKILDSQFRWNYHKNKTHFLNLFLHFWNLYSILRILKKNIIFTANVFPKLRTLKNVVTQISSNSAFKGLLEKQDIKWDQTLLKSQRHHPYHIYWWLWRKFSRKKSLLVICKVLRMFFNILTANDKYSVLNTDKLRPPIQMQ